MEILIFSFIIIQIVISFFIFNRINSINSQINVFLDKNNNDSNNLKPDIKNKNILEKQQQQIEGKVEEKEKKIKIENINNINNIDNINEDNKNDKDNKDNNVTIVTIKNEDKVSTILVKKKEEINKFGEFDPIIIDDKNSNNNKNNNKKKEEKFIDNKTKKVFKQNNKDDDDDDFL